MKTEGDILNKLNKDISYIEDEISHKNIYNVRNFVIQNLVKLGIAMDEIFPYLISGAILFSGYSAFGKTPFVVDTVTENKYIEMIDSSNGDHLQTDVNAEEIFSSIEYSTGWQRDEYGSYKRVSTVYTLNKNVDLNDIDEIFDMDKTVLDSLFRVQRVDVITESRELDLDPMYNEDVIIITRVMNTNELVEVEETVESNALTTVSFLLVLLLLSQGISKVKKILFHDFIRKNLETICARYQKLDDRRVEELKKMLNTKRENLSLLCESGDVYGKVKTR